MLKLGLGISLTNRIGAGGGDAQFAFSDLYASGEDGFIYDPSQSGLTDGDPVTGATDRINTNDATQTTAANQPVYDLTAGVHSFQANGVDQWLRIPYFPIGSDYTAIISCTDPVQDQTGTSGVRTIFAPADATPYPPGEDYHSFEFTKAGGIRMQINDDIVEDTYTPDGSPTVFTFRKEGTTGKIFRDGVEIATGTLSTTTGFATGDYALFASPVDFDTGRYAKTDLYHIMFIDRALTAQEQADAEALSATFSPDTDTTAPTFSVFNLDSSADPITSEVEIQDEAATVDFYRIYVVDDPQTSLTADDIIAGQKDDGSAADLAFGPDTVQTNDLFDLTDDISSLPGGETEMWITAVDESGNKATPESQSFTNVELTTLFADSFDTNDGPMSSRTGWFEMIIDSNVTAEVINGAMEIDVSSSGDDAMYTTVAASNNPTEQRVRVTLGPDPAADVRHVIGIMTNTNDSVTSWVDLDSYNLEIANGAATGCALRRRGVAGYVELDTSGTNLGNGDQLELVWQSGGSIQVFLNGGTTPILSAQDTSYTVGGAVLGAWGNIAGKLSYTDFELLEVP